MAMELNRLSSSFSGMKTALAACEPCHQRKRKCDRAVPSCSLCTKNSRPCFYSRGTLALLHEPAIQLAQSSGFYEAAASRLYFTWAIESPDIPESYPIDFRWYMPQLIRCFCENVGVSRIPVDHASSAYQMQTIWMKAALNDPCLFHATLFAGSSCFDLLRTEKQSPITLFHQSEAIRLINQRLSNPTWALKDSTILAITPLALFSALNADQTAANVHRIGLERLAELRGGLDKLGVDGLTSTLINRNTMIYHIAFDPDCGNVISAPPIGLELRILNPTTKNYTAPPYVPMALVKELFQEILDFKLDWISKQSATGLHHPCIDLGGQDFRFNETLPATQDPIYHCCFIAAQIFWAMVHGREHILDALVANLKASLALTDDSLWLRYLPVEYSWICFTGAAASRDAKLRLWFYFKQSSSVRLVRVTEEPYYLGDLWSHLQWLRMIGLHP